MHGLKAAAMMALPHPPKSSQKVPSNSAAIFLGRVMSDPPRQHPQSLSVLGVNPHREKT
jgi:hypothetical protein